MNQPPIFQEIRSRPSRPWMEVLLPAYSLGMVLLFYRPEVLVPALGGTPSQEILWWGLWIVIGALSGLLALSALFLVLFLLYAPVYLLTNASRLLDSRVWADRGEMRFYLGCFGLLCILLMVAFFNLEAALVSFTLLAGFAQSIWRLLV